MRLQTRDNSQGTGARDVRLFRTVRVIKVWRGDVLTANRLFA